MEIGADREEVRQMQGVTPKASIETCDILLKSCEGLTNQIDAKVSGFFGDAGTKEESQANGFDQRLRLLANQLELIRNYCERL